MLKTMIFTIFLLLGSANQSFSMCGTASWYGPGFQGKRTASGKKFDRNSLTAAHRTLKFGTRVNVTNPKNGKSVVVTITDRGPFIKGRIVDLSEKAAKLIGIKQRGTGTVCLKIMKSQ